MGCGNSKVDPTYRSSGRRVDYDDDNDDDNIKEDYILSQRSIAADDAVIGKLTGATDHAEIQVTDSQAFNNSLVQQRQQAIDNPSYRSTIESWNPNSLQQLVEIIKTLSKGKSLVDHHWIIFYWITRNIHYDTVSYFSGKYDNQTAEEVFRTRKGVCAGYANLYKYLCDQLQIPCEVVNGYSKGYGFEDRTNAPTRIDHAWNAVEIDRHWYLMEPTWGTGHLNKQNVFEHNLKPYYFLPRPNEMIYHHLPADDKWQLLQTPIKMAQFLQTPHLRPLYFEFDIELVSPLNQSHISLLPGKPYALIILRVPPDIHLMADLKLNDEDIVGGHFVMFDKRKKLCRCYFAPTKIGKHKIVIYCKKGDSDIGIYTSALDFILDVKEIPKNTISFPKTWENFFDFGLELISPQSTHLIKLNNGATHTQIRIKAPENIELIGRLTNASDEEVKKGQRVYYDQRKNIWRCNFAPDGDGLYDASIMAKKKSDPGKYISSILFKIEAKQIPSPPESYPQLWPLFDELGLKIVAPQNRAHAVWPDNASYAEVLMQAPNDIQLSCSIEYNNVIVENGSLAQFDNDKKLWQLLFAPTQTGLHELIVYAKKSNNTESPANVVVKFDLNVTKLRKPMKFPLLYTQFQAKKCQIFTPIDGILKKGSVVSVHCLIPGASEVTLAVDSQVLESSGYSNSILQRQVTVGSRELIIYAKYGQKSNYDGLIKYIVE
jgi:hypothetical protein